MSDHYRFFAGYVDWFSCVILVVRNNCQSNMNTAIIFRPRSHTYVCLNSLWQIGNKVFLGVLSEVCSHAPSSGQVEIVDYALLSRNGLAHVSHLHPHFLKIAEFSHTAHRHLHLTCI